MPPESPRTPPLRRIVARTEARITPTMNLWIGGPSGDWTDNSKWSDGVPTSDDDVVVDPLNNQTVAISATNAVLVANTITMHGDDSLFLTADGQVGEPVRKHDQVFCRVSKTKINLVRPPQMLFFDVLRAKLKWGER